MQTGKVFFVCALGAFVALQVNHYFWWVGLVVGFGVGYLAYECQTIANAVAREWRSSSIISDSVGGIMRRIVAGICSGLTLGIGIVIARRIFEGQILASLGWRDIRWLGYIDCVWVVIGMQLLSIKADVQTAEEWEEEFTEHMSAVLAIANPLRVYFWIIPKMLLRATWRLVKLLDSLMRLLWSLIKAIHSEAALLCALDAAIGAGIGYFYGSAVIGAIAGGFWGVINFELFSIRVWHLVPETESLFRRR